MKSERVGTYKLAVHERLDDERIEARVELAAEHGGRDVEAAAEVQPLEEQRALPLEPEDRRAVVDRDVRAVATSAAAAEERTAGAYEL